MTALSETCPVAGALSQGVTTMKKADALINGEGVRGSTMTAMGTEWVAPRSGDPWDVLVARLWADDGAEIVAARRLAAKLAERRASVIAGCAPSNLRLTGNPLCAYDLRRIEAAE